MTFREKLEKEHPEKIGNEYIGGCCDCPSTYGYEKRKCNKFIANEFKCTKCWDREIPTEPKEDMDKEDYENLGYIKGLQDAWELAKKIAMEKSNGGFSSYEIVDIFGFNDMDAIFMYYTPQEALAELKAYEEKEIKVGDVVLYGENSTEKFLVIADDNKFVWAYSHESSVQNILKDELRKTGQKLDITSLLGQIRGAE